MMYLLGQQDAKWADVKIGKSKSKIKDYGCTITSIAMLSSWYGCYKDPAWMAKNLSFLRDLIIWSSISRKLCFRFIWRQYGHNEQKILSSINGKTTSCLLQISKRHWVVAISKLDNFYYVADPWRPEHHVIHKNYVSGSAHFDK